MIPTSNARTGARIETANLAKSYPGTGLVVDSLSLSFEPGEFVALLGPSGCGKSTFLRLLAGLEEADSGWAKVASPLGAPVKRGFVFQDSTLMPWRDALANARLPLELGGVESSAADARALEELARVGLANAARRLPRELSGGMRMRVSVARALAPRPQALFLDEPFAALDEGTRHQLQDELRSIWSELGMTVVFVTHSVAEAVYLADRVVLLSGRPARLRREIVTKFGTRGPGFRASREYFEKMREVYELSQEVEPV